MCKKNLYKILVRKPEGKKPHARSRMDEKITLKWILKKQDARVWTTFI
jgi:hypothetical protein